jgi:ElaA protein
MTSCHFQLKHFEALSNHELYRILRLRQEVFVVEQHCPFVDCDDRDQASWHLLCYTDSGSLAAYCRLLPVGLAYEGYASIGRVISSYQHRGEGYGIALMEEAVKQCVKLYDNAPIQIGAQLYLKKYYERFGFQAVREVYLEDDIEHIHMIRT